MKYTQTFSLKKPDLEDFVVVGDLNENMDILDRDLGHLKGSKALTDALLQKLQGLSNYAHPANHSINMITDSPTHVKMTVAEREKLANSAAYVHPSSHPASMITETAQQSFVTAAEKTKWNDYRTIDRPTEIVASANLNALTSVGYYVSKTHANAATLGSSPTARAFRLEVTDHIGLRQVIRDADGKTYERDRIGTVWSAWTEVARKGNLTASDVGLGNVTNVKQATADELNAHIIDPYPHRFVDGTTGKTYKYGFGVNAQGGLVFKYLEV